MTGVNVGECRKIQFISDPRISPVIIVPLRRDSLGLLPSEKLARWSDSIAPEHQELARGAHLRCQVWNVRGCLPCSSFGV